MILCFVGLLLCVTLEIPNVFVVVQREISNCVWKPKSNAHYNQLYESQIMLYNRYVYMFIFTMFFTESASLMEHGVIMELSQNAKIISHENIRKQ